MQTFLITYILLQDLTQPLVPTPTPYSGDNPWIPLVSALIGGILTIGAVYIKEYLTVNKTSDTQVKLAEISTQGNVETLANNLKEAVEKIKYLEEALEREREAVRQEREARQETESRIKDVNLVFGVMYGTLEKIIRETNNENGLEMLGKLKDFIDG